MSGRYTKAADSPWLEGVVEVQFEDEIRPGSVLVRSGQAGALSDMASSAFPEKVGAILRQYGILQAAASFQTSPDEADRLYEEARKRGVPLPHQHSFVTLQFPRDADTGRIARELDEQPGVVRAVPVPISLPPQDPLLGSTDQLKRKKNSPLELQWYIFRCKADAAWQTSRGRGVVVANLDWGFDVTHVDLAANIDPSKAFNSVDSSSNVSQGAAVAHGTAATSLIGAAANGVGLVGFAPEATLWTIQANISGVPAGGQAQDAKRWVDAIEWVRNKASGGPRVVMNIEAQTGNLGNYEMVPSFNLAIQYAIAWDIVVCLAAGNGNRDAGRDDQAPPQAIPDSGAIVVGATRYSSAQNIRWAGSNWGGRVTIFAPGDPVHDVSASDNGGWENLFGGTSGATPKVAGTAALMLAANPALTPHEVRQILRDTATPLAAEPGKPPGHFLDSHAAVCKAAALAAPAGSAAD